LFGGVFLNRILKILFRPVGTHWFLPAGITLFLFLQAVAIGHYLVANLSPPMQFAGYVGSFLGMALVVFGMRDILRKAARKEMLIYYMGPKGVLELLPQGILSVVLEEHESEDSGRRYTLRVVAANRAACNLFGRLKNHLIGRPLDELLYHFPAVTAEEEDKYWEDVVFRGTSDFVGILRGRNGEMIPADIVTRWFYPEEGQCTGFFFFSPIWNLVSPGQEEGVEPRKRGVYVRSMSGELKMVNQAFGEIAGTETRNLIGASLGRLAPDQEWTSAPLSLDRIFFRRPDAERAAWGAVREFPLREPSGNVAGIVGIALDVTTEMEDILIREEELRYLGTLFAEAPQAMVIQGCRGELIRANVAFARLFGYDPANLEGLVGRDVDELVCGPGGESLPEANELTRTAVAGGSFSLESVRFRVDGTPIPVDVRGRHIELPGGGSVVFGMYVDLSERKSSLAAVAASEARFRAIFDNAQVAIILYDSNRLILAANQTFGRLVGCRPGDLAGRKIDDFLGSEDYQAAQIVHSTLLSGSTVGPVLRTYVRNDGGRVSVRVTPSLCPGGSPENPHLLAVVEDLSEMESVLADLRRERAYFEDLFQIAPVAVALSSPDDRVQDVNRAFSALFGYSPDEIRGQCLDQLVVPPELMEEGLRLTDRIFGRNESSHLCDTIRVRKDGKRVEVSVEILPIFLDGRLHGAYTVYTDLTHHKQVQRQIQESETLHKAIVETQSEFIFQLGPDGRVLFANGACASFFGRGRQTLMGTSFFELVSPSEAAECRRKLRAIRPCAPLFQCDMKIYDSAGKERVVKWTGRALFDTGDEGRVEWVLLVGRDVSDYRFAMQELVHAREEAEGALRARSALLSYLSHEIRTPLMTVRGIMGSLRHLVGGRSEDQAPPWYRNTNLAIDQIVHVLDSILDLSKLEAGGGRFKMEPVNVREALTEVVGSFDEAARSKGVEVRRSFQFPDGEWYVTDGLRLRQILFNLVGNAVKYTDTGWIEVIAEEVQNEEGVSLLLQVRDTGHGMAREDIPGLFKAFRRGMSERYVPGSVGLGLAITRNVVDGLGGRITVQSSPGRGSTFRVRLPVSLADALPSEPGKEEVQNTPSETGDTAGKGEEPVRRTITVLIVEDHTVNRDLLAQMVRETRGCVVHAVESGLAAMDFLQRKRVDLVLLDVMMPGMSGVEVAEKWREIELLSGAERVAIVGVTAFSSTEDHRMFISAGMDSVMVKPVDPVLLDEVIRGVMRSAPPRDGQTS
jgi:PAS domain S-box-containing protein